MGKTISHTSYGIAAAKMPGYPNVGSWNTRLTDVTTTPMETIGIQRKEGVNTYEYVQFGTGAITAQGVCVKLQTGLTDPNTNSIIAPNQMTQLGATAAGYYSAYGITVGAVASGIRYGWICIKGIGTLPLNSNTAGLAFGTPIAPSSSSAVFAQCALGSQVGWVMEVKGETLGTATQTAQGGNCCIFDFHRYWLF